jgi:predicted nucleic acid-binding protein
VITYVDTSAAMKLLVDEGESSALVDKLQELRAAGETLVSSWLLHTELCCAANRHPADVAADAVEAVLSALALVDIDRADLIAAPSLPGRLRSADAIHLASALRVGCDAILVYDEDLRAAARTVGIRPLSPS